MAIDTEKKDTILDICPCCRQPTLKRPLKINQALIDQWMACMMTATPFSHTYPVYGGRLEITVTRLAPELTDKEERLMSLLDMLHRHDWGEAGAPINTDQMRTMARLYISIVTIKIHTAEGTRIFKPQESVLAALDKLNPLSSELSGADLSDECIEVCKKVYWQLTNPESVSAVPVDVLIAVVDTHSRISLILMDTGFDENFWKGIELA